LRDEEQLTNGAEIENETAIPKMLKEGTKGAGSHGNRMESV
jgi:hypothetical protein